MMTEQGKEKAQAALDERRAVKVEKIDNASLVAGSPMYFYCISCGHLAGILPEGYLTKPPKLCDECAALKEMGWLE